MTYNKLYPLLQSAYRKNHSTETALLKVKNDLLLAMNKGHVSLLVLLDLSAAFDTVDYDILMRRLSTKIGLKDIALSWFSSYLTGRHQKVSVNGNFSDMFELKCGVPQGSCRGPLLFTIYASKLFNIIELHLPDVHAYADDTQLYISFNPDSKEDTANAIMTITQCINDLQSWMIRDKLMFNPGKTEIALFGTPQQLQKVTCNNISVGDVNIHLVDVFKNLGVWFDASLTMSTHVNKTSSSAFFYLYNIRHIRKFLSRQHTETLIHAFITSRLDYCNSLLYGLPDTTLCKLQRIQNACARLIYNSSKFCHITPLLKELHWLPIRQRIAFKLLLITFKSLHRLAPIYLTNLIKVAQPSRYNLRSANNGICLSYPRLKSKKTLADRSFVIAAPTLWNNLPADIPQNPTY